MPVPPQHLEPRHPLVRTNPIYACKEKWRWLVAANLDPRQTESRFVHWLLEAYSAGAYFPRTCWQHLSHNPALEQMSQPLSAPRIIGLLHASGGYFEHPVGLVTAIRAEKSASGWSAAEHLPFKWESIQEAFLRLIGASIAAQSTSFPEAQAFSLEGTLNIASDGSSMNIAGLLAVIDALNDYQAVGSFDWLSKACAIVRPDGNELKNVGYEESKLDAFKREYGRGSLLVCTPNLPGLRQHKEFFDHVWEVDSYRALADRLSDAGLMRKVFEGTPITLAMAKEAQGAIQRICRIHGDTEAWKSAKRLVSTMENAGVESERVKQWISEAVEDYSRHSGNFDDAIRYSRRSLSALEQLGPDASFQELAAAKTRLAASLFDAHCFQDAIDLLQPIIDTITAEPRMMAAETRVNVMNTFGRTLIMLNRDGWEDLFLRSISVQEKVDPSNRARSRCYLIHGLLRSNRLSEAKQQIDDCFEIEDRLDSVTKTFVAFYAAELYRRDCSVGPRYRENAEIEQRPEGHALAFYWQATARQMMRGPDDRRSRFEMAIKVLDGLLCNKSQCNILLLLKLLLQYAQDGRDAGKRLEIQAFLQQSAAERMRDWYGDLMALKSPQAEQWLLRFPYL